MRVLQTLVAIGAFASLSATGAEAARFDLDYVLARGTSQTYRFTFSDAYAGQAIIIADGYYTFRDPINGDFREHWPYITDCFLDKYCSRVDGGLGGYVKLSVTPTLHGFDILADNRVQSFDNCVEATRDHSICGASFDIAHLTLGVVTSGTYDVSVSSNPVPEPATWAFMMAGFGIAGVALRRRAKLVAA